MGLIRLIVLLLILGAAWFVVKNYLRKQQLRNQRRDARNEPPQITDRIVRCKHCHLHLPEMEAVRDGDEWFCTQAHRLTWQAKHKL